MNGFGFPSGLPLNRHRLGPHTPSPKQSTKGSWNTQAVSTEKLKSKEQNCHNLHLHPGKNKNKNTKVGELKFEERASFDLPKHRHC